MKKSKLTALLLVFMVVLSATSSFAQDSTFKLSDYKNPNYFYQSLDLNFGLNSGLRIDKLNATNGYGSNDFSINSNTGATYSLSINSPKTQTELQSFISAAIESSVYNQDMKIDNYKGNRNKFSQIENLNLNGLKRFYNEKQNYFEVGGTLYCRFDGSKDKNKSTTSFQNTNEFTEESKRFNLDITGVFLIGKGRIEQVQDARLAMYLLDDLKNLKRENQQASDEDVLALARTITSLKYKRFFDGRLRKIHEITVIDSFLFKNNIAGTADAAYFTSLNDNWNYANNPIRYSGKRLFTGIEGKYSHTYFNHISEVIEPVYELTEYTIYTTPVGVNLVAGINFENPKTLTWQNSANIKIGVGIQQWIENRELSDTAYSSNSYNQSFPSMKLEADYGFGYYPNSRTWLTFDWWILSGWDKEMYGNTKKDKEDYQNSFYTYTGPEFHAYYYLSEKLRLSLSYTGYIYFSNNKYKYDVPAGESDHRNLTFWNHRLNAGLTYSLF